MWTKQSATVSLLLLIAASVLALEVPPPPNQWVSDRAGILSASDRERLNTKLREFENRSGNQFIVYILPSLEGEALEDFTVRAAEKWKVGQAKYDNGLILFVFPEDRKLRIEVAYGLEEKVTDAYASRVVRETIVPRFRQNDYAGGIEAGVDQLIAKIEGRAPPEPIMQPDAQPVKREATCSDIGFGIIFFIVVLIILISLSRTGCLPIFLLPGGGGGVTFGGGGGGGGGGFGGFSGGGGSFGGGGASGSW